MVWSSVTGVPRTWVNGCGMDSCTLCFLCTGSKPLYAATFLSFLYALGYLTVECLVYHTVSATTLSLFIFIAGTVHN